MTKILEGQLALVTGGGSGIGRATAQALAAAGARVVISGRRRALLDEVVAQIHAQGGQAWAQVVDLEDRESLLAMVGRVEQTLGRIDILINNAGSTSQVRNIRWIDPVAWDSTFAVNLTAVYTLVQAVLPGMLAAGGGTLITVSSLAAVRPNLLGGAPYGAAKAGVRNLMGYLHATFRNDNIRATTILPGEVSTPIMDTRVRPPAARSASEWWRPRTSRKRSCCAAACRHAPPSKS
ncbi:SDR family NAD(P)-dependent oxidoreductase [Pseudomonas sp. TH31]|uniref:SDR family NAD(P)-dependent oxidoreductase n=1 Tax=Pseudomonas sp. TH31 TaxID=2796396 RepID=UPI0019132C40|nr:SDR family NAD(P)-dependent oxidoreductase [Pseudomonas sp. TH31]MBK5416075.1 SDR family oxidoreductase [Pseudomonas sp. TH31]